ncbi:hypothetical protein MBLNU459_g4249t2 [Dothideomycetes sp. NU459]
MSSMQKTYDDCYLICSTAVYFESQNNEAEALRSWRNALDQIYYHNAYRMPTGWRPKTETEKALQDSLRQMELQCKERVDLLETLRQSRAEAAKEASGLGITNGPPQAKISSTSLVSQDTSDHSGAGNGVGGGTIPPVDISRLAPALPHRSVPKRPSYTSKSSSGYAVPRTRTSPSQPTAATFSPPAPSSSATLAPQVVSPRQGSRTPSPEKKGGMLRTLRGPAAKDRSSSGKMTSRLRSQPPVASAKAATQAWGTTQTQRPSIGSIEQAMADADRSHSTTTTTWDPYTRTLVERPMSRDTASAPVPPRHAAPSPAPSFARGSSSNTVVRSPSPSDYFISSPELGQEARPDAHLSERGRQDQQHPPPYPDYPSLSSVHASKPYEHGNDLGPPDPVTYPPSAPPPVPPQAPPSSLVRPPTNNSRLRRHSPPQLPKMDRLPSYRKEYPAAAPSKYVKPPNARAPRTLKDLESEASSSAPRPATKSKPKVPPAVPRKAVGVLSATRARQELDERAVLAGHSHSGEEHSSGYDATPRARCRRKEETGPTTSYNITSPELTETDTDTDKSQPQVAVSDSQAWDDRVAYLMAHLPKGVDEGAAKQIFNEIVIQGDEVHWDDVAGLEIAKSALKETVVYPFLRPDLFMGLREPARGMLLFGPPGTGKTMLARAVATESRSTFFAISASSLTSKYLGESEKLVRALFSLAKALAPSIIFVDEIDSLLSSRGGGSEHEATRRIKTEFLIQWSDLAKAAAGRETSERDKERGDASRVLVLAATNLPWAIDEAARRRFVRRQYIPLPEDWVRKLQLGTLLSAQKHAIGDAELNELVRRTENYSGSDITALAKDAAMGPLRSLGERLLHMSPEDIRPINFQDFVASLKNIRPSVGRDGLKPFEDWAREYGERGG